jgi:hypothetical protein
MTSEQGSRNSGDQYGDGRPLFGLQETKSPDGVRKQPQHGRLGAEECRDSKSPSPDPELLKFLVEQARPDSPDSEAYRKQRLAAAGVWNAKSRHQKEKEEAERRKREAEDDAAKVYEDFIEHMNGAESSKRRRVKDIGFVRAGGNEAYQTSVLNHTRDDVEGQASVLHVNASEDDNHRRLKTPQHAKQGAMKSFLGELQRNQATREERLKDQISDGMSVSSLLAQEMQRGGVRDSDDPTSTNLCVFNLPANVSESSLAVRFSVYGDVASVKIMWPRDEEVHLARQDNGYTERSTRHAGATGFVNFMERSDAQQAYRGLDGTSWDDCSLRIRWSKGIGKATIPMCRKLVASSRGSNKGNDTQPGESPLRERSINLPPFRDQGEKFVYDRDTSAQSDHTSIEDSEDHDVNFLAARFDAMLRSLTLRRERIADVMLYAIENTLSADVLTDRLVQSLLQVATPLPRKLARLYAVSDILHNSAAATHGAWRYRALLAGRMDTIFAHWGDIANSFAGRIKREDCKDSVRTLLDVWESWMVFEGASLTRWRSLLEHGCQQANDAQPSKSLSHLESGHHSQDKHKAVEEEDIDGEAMAFEDESLSFDPSGPVHDSADTLAAHRDQDIDGEEM